MSKKVLVTGISGFAGSHLAEKLFLANKYKLIGTYLSDKSLGNISSLVKEIELIKIDLNDKDKVLDLIKKVQPDLIYHLAAFTSPSESFKKPTEAIVNNVSIQINLLEAVRQIKLFNTRILIISSADIYGTVSKEDLPIDEETSFMPANTYAVSKITQDFLGLQYYLSYNLNIVRVRPFNHIGPRQTPYFVISSFAKQIAEIEKGVKEPVLYVGNLETKRDFTDVRDMVEAYILAVEKGNTGDVYNLGSGVSYKISELLEKLLSFVKVKISVEKDSSLFRPNDTPELLCDNQKFKELTHWEQKIAIDTTLKDTLDYWRNIV